ncbi:S9 family peptidase, partial [Parabacteroides sp. OttesenSCG-928-K15]|nr:S9 family peptidase [Parabacteroides sp. OttesenSCG-928-K15]
MYKKILVACMAILFTCLSHAEETKVMNFLHVGPFPVSKPILADSLNVNGKAFEVKNLLKTTIPLDKAFTAGTVLEADTAATITWEKPEQDYALHLFSFYLNSDRFTKGSLEVKGNGEFEVFVDNKSVGKTASLNLEPRRYDVTIKYLTSACDSVQPTLTVLYKTTQEASVTAGIDAWKRYTMKDFTEGTNLSSIGLSANGKYLLVKTVTMLPNDRSTTLAQLRDAATGNVLLQDIGFLRNARWMPKSNLLYYTRTGQKGEELVTVDPVNLKENILINELPKGSFRFSPDETFLLFNMQEEGPKEGNELIRVLNPNDRVPGYRNRSFIWRYDLQSGLFRQLTYGHNTTRLNDVSADSRYLLFSTSDMVYTSLPHGRNSLYKLDMHTMEVDTIWEGEKYISSAAFSPDMKQLMVFGSGNAFGDIGLKIKEGQLSNTYDVQLFTYDLATRQAKALTKEFDPSVSNAVWHKRDNQIYIQAVNKDYQSLYVCNPVNGQIRQIETKEEVITAYTIAETSPLLYYFGQSVSNSNRLYAVDLKKGKEQLIYDLSAEKLKDIELGKAEDFNFVSTDGT